MKALILCAGKGTRLKHLTVSTPKCLVKIEEKCIIDYQIEALVAAGINDITVVAGYCADQVRRHVPDTIKIIINHQFETTNSIYSLWLAKDEFMDEAFILINGDIILEDELMRRLAQYEGCAALVDKDKPLKDGEMNVVIDHDKILEFSKQVKACDAQGESVQVTKFGVTESRLLFRQVKIIIERKEINQFPAYAYDIIFHEAAMRPVYTDGKFYYEIDTLDDYEACCHQLSLKQAAD